MTWYHGDRSERERFDDQRWDRDASEASLNEEGPGLYCTSSLEEATNYGSFVFEVVLSSSFELLPRRKPNIEELLAFFRSASSFEKTRFLADWGTSSPRRALSRYTHQDSLHDALVTLYGDLIHDPAEWIAAVQGLGYDGSIIDKSRGRQHLIVYSVNKVRFKRIQ